MDRYAARRDKLSKAFRKAGADALLVTNFVNVTYLTGFTGDDSYLLVGRDGRAILLSDPRYTTQLEEECPGLELEIRPPGTKMIDSVGRVLQAANPRKLAIEADSMSVALRDRIAETAPERTLVPTGGLVESLRVTKDSEEIARLRVAVDQAQRAFSVLRATLRPEKTEKMVAAELEHQFRLFGATHRSFASIIAVGPRAALPHARPTDVRVEAADFILVDWGADEGLYKSDLTRVLVTGRISPKLQRIYEVVLKAQLAGIAAIRPGAVASEVDRAARQVIEAAGFGKQFGHGLGHGLGLEVHEAPRLNSISETVLKPGMVITVEPGIYLPGWGGVRIEDDVLVTRDGHEVLTSVPKRLEEMIVA